MPTQSTTYNTRLTDETLEKRFRDTFRSQGGAELVDDLYASGVIVPIVDFTTAAEGSVLRQDLQTAWDFATTQSQAINGTITLVNTPGFWRVSANFQSAIQSGASQGGKIALTDGLSSKTIWQVTWPSPTGVDAEQAKAADLVVFLRTGDSVTVTSNNANTIVDCWTRQIADVSGNLTNPTGFQSS